LGITSKGGKAFKTRVESPRGVKKNPVGEKNGGRVTHIETREDQKEKGHKKGLKGGTATIKGSKKGFDGGDGVAKGGEDLGKLKARREERPNRGEPEKKQHNSPGHALAKKSPGKKEKLKERKLEEGDEGKRKGKDGVTKGRKVGEK